MGSGFHARILLWQEGCVRQVSMEPSRNRQGWWSLLLLVLVLLGGVIAAIFVPWSHCEYCWKEYAAARSWANASEKMHPELTTEIENNVPHDCWRCNGRHWMSLYERLCSIPSRQ